MPKLSEYVKVAEEVEILGVSLGTVRTWAADVKIPMHRSPANRYHLFMRISLPTLKRSKTNRISRRMDDAGISLPCGNINE